MTFRAAIGELIRRAWAVAVVAVMVGAGAYLIASRHHAAFQASAVVSHKPVKARREPHGLKRLVLEPTPAALAIGSDYPSTAGGGVARLEQPRPPFWWWQADERTRPPRIRSRAT